MRIRTLKPDFWKHQIMAQQRPEVRLLAIEEGNFNHRRNGRISQHVPSGGAVGVQQRMRKHLQRTPAADDVFLQLCRGVGVVG